MPGPPLPMRMVVRLEAQCLSQGFDDPGRGSAFRGGPSRGLRLAVFHTEHVVPELIEPVRVSGDVILVVGVLGDPDVGDGQIEGRVGVGHHRDPLVGVDGRAVVEVGAHEDALDAYLPPPVHQAAGHLAVEGPGRGLGVAAPEEQQLGVLGDVGHQVADRLHLAHRLHAPGVLGAPVGPLPAVGVADLLGEAAQHLQQLVLAAVGAVDDLGLAVAVALAEHRVRPVLGVLALEFAGEHVEGFVPGDAHVLALTALVGVAAARAGGAGGAVGSQSTRFIG